ncbi:hypothetical protein R80B4_00998 [Fibrobacteres bacterium R8-0-B4]
MVPKVTKGQLCKLQKTLKTDERIGQELNMSRQAVHQLRKRLGVAAASTEKPERDAEIAEAYIAGETGIAIAKRFGMSISQTYRIINSANGKGKRRAAARRAGLPVPKELGRKASGKKKSSAKKAVKKTSAVKKAPAKKKIGKKRSKKR